MRAAGLVILLSAAALCLGGEESPEVTIEPREGGWAVSDLLYFVAERTGEPFSFQSETLKGVRVEFVGVMEVPGKDLFSWLQSLLSFNRLVLVPTEVGETTVWRLLEVGGLRRRPISRNGEEVWLHLCAPLGHLEPDRMIGILGALTEGSSSQFLPVPDTRVLHMYGPRRELGLIMRLIRELDVPSPETQRQIERLERLLAEARAEVAAQRLLRRIRALRRKSR